nr:hypothetical protein [Caldilineaceae bacterium]
MIQLSHHELSTVRPWFEPEAPGPLTGGPHVLNTGCGAIWVDRWPEPQAMLVDTARNYLLLGDPAALTPAHLKTQLHGFVATSPAFVPLLQATFAQIVAWDRVVYTLPVSSTWQKPAGFT